MDEVAIRGAVTELQVLVEGDGALVTLEQLDGTTGEVTVRLDLSRVHCLDCVMPSGVLADIVGDRIRKADAGVARVSVLDPRVEPVD